MPLVRLRSEVKRWVFGAASLVCLAPLAHADSTGPSHGEWGVQTEHLSETIKPGDDFYTYVNEGWINATPIPPDRNFLSEPWVAQLKIYDDVAAIMEGILTQPRAAEGSAERRLQDLHRSYIDAERIEALGVAPIQGGLDRIARIETHDQVAQFMGDPMASSLFHLIVKPPVDMQGGYILSLEQYRVTGLGLPGQVYYKSDEEPFGGHRAAYLDYIAESFALAGLSDGPAHAERVLDLETRFANVMWDFARLRDAGAAFDLISTAQLREKAPGFPWDAYFEAKGIWDLNAVNFGIGGITESAALFNKIPIESWKSYLAFHWVRNHADYLPDRFGESRFRFYDQRLYGVAERTSRGDRATELIQGELGWDVGSLYVAKHFPESSNQKVLEIGEYVRRAFREQLLETEWMDDVTRAEALAKADAIIFEIAEPKERPDLAALETRSDDLIGNIRRLREERWKLDLDRLGRPISRWGDWNMYPHRVGLGFHQQYNKIFITAGALLPPFFDPKADMAVNFGSIGSTSGHEFGHSLDDQGSKFDSRGALRDWWTPAARAAYEQRTRRLIEQFGDYEALPDVSLKSDQMIGEIVGDLTGALIGRRAYELYLQDHPEEAGLVLGGFTGPQRYWLALTQKTRMVANDEALRSMARQASQPPPPFSVNGVLSNLEDWYRDFEVEPGAAMYLPDELQTPLW
ncbi:M13 family metallopeptidase [uncultured Erythrobacter sp.]|uniref:M13-type metalloendopeptidase n=1 Tax=uncultured Erythrobacter sp. TaxID=263913 RepID=UPI0026275295|nr:M13 family metallopeptidase [uncultured Erythrobacter sp.]